METSQWITIRETEKLLHRSFDTIQDMARAGKIITRYTPPKTGGQRGRWHVDRASVLAYIASQRVYRKPTVAEAAWAAGFIDGEGSLQVGVTRQVQKSGHITISHSAYVCVAQTDREPLDWLAEMFGGTVREVKRYSSQHNRCWNWLACSQNAERVLRAIMPYLRLKHPQALLLLELCDQKHAYRCSPRTVTSADIEQREAIKNQVQILNKRKEPAG
jgi:hypothetical protein